MKKIFRYGLLVGFVTLTVFFFLLDPGEYGIFPRCVFYSLTGYYCPGCGSQRAIHNLLHLNFYGAASNNFLFIPALLAILYHYLHPLLNRKLRLKLPNIFYLKSIPWAIFGIVLLFWIIRNLPCYPFSWFAPDQFGI